MGEGIMIFGMRNRKLGRPYISKEKQKPHTNAERLKELREKRKRKFQESMQILLKGKFVRHIGREKSISITFTKNGNNHLYYNAFGKRGLHRSDLTRMGDILMDSEYIGQSSLYKKRKDRNVRFFYFKTKRITW